jgi:hypothetical protein
MHGQQNLKFFITSFSSASGFQLIYQMFECLTTPYQTEKTLSEEIILLLNEELNGLYSLPNIVRVIKSRRLRWSGACSTYGWKERCVRRLRLFENRVLMRIFGPKRDEVTGEWIKLHNEELNYLYASPTIVRVIKSRRIREAGHRARMGKRRSVYRIWWEIWGKEPLGRPRRRSKHNIKMDLQEVGCGSMD